MEHHLNHNPLIFPDNADTSLYFMNRLQHSKMSASKCNLSPALKEKARTELNENDDTRDSYVQDLREKVLAHKGQDYIPYETL